MWTVAFEYKNVVFYGLLDNGKLLKQLHYYETKIYVNEIVIFSVQYLGLSDFSIFLRFTN